MSNLWRFILDGHAFNAGTPIEDIAKKTKEAGYDLFTLNGHIFFVDPVGNYSALRMSLTDVFGGRS